MDLGYIDAQSGSMILQIILGGAAAVAVALKMWWGRVLRFLHIRGPEDDAPAVEQRRARSRDARERVARPGARGCR